jgi:hypothetical protein
MATLDELHTHLASLDAPVETMFGDAKKQAAHVAHVTNIRAAARVQLAARIADVAAGKPDPLFVTVAAKPTA